MKHVYTLTLLALTALLSLCAIQPVQAQKAVQDALYIFRNDGGFDAFFYGDIDHIGYSKTDTLGEEHDDYVVQEVYALDTIYRIPISAIDSVAFVTPETKIKADVFCPDKSIADYIIGSDSVNWILLAANTPASMIPKVGDKIFIKDASRYIPDGFVGFVSMVNQTDGCYLVMTESLELTDVFERLVAKAAAAAVPNAAAASKAGVNGLIDGTEMSYTDETPIEWPTISGAVPFQGSYAMGDLGPVSFSGDIAGAINYSIGTKMAIRAFLFIDAVTETFKYDQKTESSHDVSLGVSLTGSITASVDIPIKKLGANLSEFFKANIKAGIFVGAQFAAMSMAYTSKYKVKAYTTLVADQDDIFTPQVSSPLFRYHYDYVSDGCDFTGGIDGTWSLSTGAFAEANLGVRYPFQKPSKPNKIGVGVKLRLEAGGKLEFKVPSLGGTLTEIASDIYNTRAIYRSLDEAGEVGTMVYGKVSLSGEVGKWKNSFDPELDLLKISWFGLVPRFTGITVGFDKEEPFREYRVRATLGLSRNLLVSQKVGIAVLDTDGKEVDNWLNRTYSTEKLAKEMPYTHVFTSLDPVKDKSKTYRLYPEVEWKGFKLLSDAYKEVTVEPARFDIEKRILHVDENNGYQNIGVQTNMSNVEVKTDADWMSGDRTPVWLAHLNELTVFWPELPEGVNQRRGVVRLIGKTQKGEVILEDSVVVIQAKPFVELSMENVELGAKGGTKTVTVVNTNLKDITAKVLAGIDYIHVTLEKGVITITVDPNEDASGRSSYIIVDGVASDGTVIRTFINVNQLGTEDFAYAWAEPNVVQLPCEGGATFSQYDYGDFNYASMVIPESATSWIDGRFSVDIQSPNRYKWQIYISVAPNETDKARQDTIKLYFAEEKGLPFEERYCVPVVVKQAAGPYKLQDLYKLFAGTWNAYTESNNSSDYSSRQETFNADGTYKVHTVYTVGSLGEETIEGTYTINSWTLKQGYLSISIKQSNRVYNSTLELYPHFMLLNGYNYER